jgi:hypothetical protein
MVHAATDELERFACGDSFADPVRPDALTRSA